ncbi:MAG: hypothetical protein NTW29_01970 [Bacteroidetes bacterium]|nr:hypothetical protein [Bacteroidota bacterium]
MKKIILLLAVIQISHLLHAQCDCSRRPIVFVHGFMASGDTYAGQIIRLKEAGYCADRLFVFDWNSVNGNGKKNDSLLSNFIDEVLAKTGSKTIDLVGHSAGGGLARGYLIDSAGAAKVEHYIHLGSRKWFTQLPWFSNEKCLNIFSAADKTMGPSGGVVEGAHNLDLKDKDHYEVATSKETFDAILQFLEVTVPVRENSMLNAANSNPIILAGKAVLLGDNSPMKKAQVNIYRVAPLSGNRLGKIPERTFTTDSTGRWGPYDRASAEDNFELELIPANKEQRTISYFFENFTVSDEHIYLRGFPTGSMLSAFTGSIPVKKEQSAIVIYSATRAMIAGRDSVSVNGIPLTTRALMPAEKTIISSFIFDNGDGKSSAKSLEQFGKFPFLAGVDISLPAGLIKPHTIYYNGRNLTLPTVSSKERVMIAVFK